MSNSECGGFEFGAVGWLYFTTKTRREYVPVDSQPASMPLEGLRYNIQPPDVEYRMWLF